MVDPSLASLPMLVADLARDDARDLLETVAADEGTIIVPLVIAPADTSRHILEVYSPGFEEALVLLADPVGAPTPKGFPLRLTLPPNARRDPKSAITLDAKDFDVEPRRITTHNLTEEHERRLSTGKKHPPVRITGRKLANGKLVIETFVGSGGAGSVYKAIHRELQIPVAVKVLHEELQRDVDFCRRFHAEALAASRLDHANLTRVIDFGQEPDGTLYLAMEFLAGRVLRDVLEKDGKLSMTRALGIMAQVCAGLAHAHARGVVHRDVKPENMVLLASTDDDGRAFELVKVCDFGIAQQPTATESTDLAGTPEYMAPEQWTGDELGAGTDVYACGVMLYELTTGQLPFKGKPREIFERQMKGPPDPPSKHVPGFDPRLEAVIMRTLAQDVAQRPADMRALRTLLRELRLSRMDMAKVKVPSLSPPATHAAPPPAIKEEEPPPPSEDPEWLERSGAWAARAQDTSPKPPGAQEDPVAQHLLRDPTPILAELVKTTDPAAFHKLAVMVDPAIRSLAVRRESATLWRLVSTIDILADEGPRTPGSRAAIAASLLRVAYDPQVLGPIAEEALLTERQTLSPAWKLVVRAATGGVYALYQARLKHVGTESRHRFVRLYREIGAPVLPVVRAGLERLASRLENEAATDLAIDLLDATPHALDDATGEIIARYVQARNPTLTAAAASAVVKVWGVRAGPVLVGLLHHVDERAVSAAIAGLCDLHAIDEPIARKLSNVVAVHPETAARIAAVDAIAKAEASGLAFAGRTLRRMLASVSEKWPPSLALAVVRALLAVGDANDRTLIRDQSRVWPPSLVVAVTGVLGGK